MYQLLGLLEFHFIYAEQTKYEFQDNFALLILFSAFKRSLL